ncbi:efflux transporter outer membrane subunit [Ideonella sp. DXS29W]|uniref:Efflux transporter outer membrane subunit n=1 Tax=Ideonella lacteola TaxID=2984193 RepID=A0ABU9BNN5_9BURK
MTRMPVVNRLVGALPLFLSAGLLAGCINLAPDYQRPASPVPAALPTDAATPDAALPAVRELLRDERLRQIVDQALANNRDLRVAMLNVERSRAQLRLADADRWPTVAAAVNGTRAPNTSTGDQTNTFQAGLQVTSYELDLFGRLRNVSDSAAASLLGTEAGARAARLALVTQVASTWFTLAADQEQLALARQTLAGREQTLKLTELRVSVGAASDVDLHGARGLLAQAQATVAQLQRQTAVDANALTLVVGQAVPASWLPSAEAPLNGEALAAVPVGALSDWLLARPDVIQAEQALIAANANIGAARAAMFPRITLSGSAGVVSDTLRGLVESGTFAWTLGASAAMSIFDAGRNQANIKAAEVTREIAVAQYEKAIQTAFRETADALVSQATWRDQVTAQQALQAGEKERARLTRMRYEAGTANLIELLDSERSLAAADQALVLARLGELLNRLALYKALGGEERAVS